MTSGAALLWRLHGDASVRTRERHEAAALRIVGVCSLMLALKVTYDALQLLVSREVPQRIIFGSMLAVASLIVMPILCAMSADMAGGAPAFAWP